MNEISNISPVAIPVPRSPTLNVAGGLNQSNVTNTTSAAVRSLSTETVSALVAQSEQKLSPESITEAVKAGNTILQASNKNLSFQIDDITKQVIVSVVDRDTGEVVRQIPTVEMLDFMRAMALQETNSGKLLHAKA